MSSKAGIFIVGAKRTAFGTYGGTLKNRSAIELAEVAGRAVLKETNVKPEQVDHVIFGNVIQSCVDAVYLPRHIGLRLGIPEHIPALGVNRLCGSGFQAVACAAQQILLGESTFVLAGGTENMSMTPFSVRNIRFGTSLGVPYEFEDTLWAALTDSYTKMPMGMTAEKLGAKYGVTREDADRFAIRSQTLWKKANDAGVFKTEITPFTIKSKKGEIAFEVDEHPRITSLEKLSKLPAVFKKDGLINAGNASGINDGAAALLVAGEETIAKYGLKPLARVVAWHSVGVDPTIMGFGPVPAIRGLLKRTGLTLNDIDLIEVNEAFAPQALAVQRELNIPDEKLNVNGGAIAIGHPLGASGARITTHLVHEMRRKGVKYSVGSACIGGGQGIAMLLENVQ